jgi:predicted site-specific integrase-resolvase
MWRPEALQVLGCSISTFKRYVKAGKIRFDKIGNRYMYWDDDVYKLRGKHLIREHWTVA